MNQSQLPAAVVAGAGAAMIIAGFDLDAANLKSIGAITLIAFGLRVLVG